MLTARQPDQDWAQASRSDRGQFEDREISAEQIYTISDQEADSWDNKDTAGGDRRGTKVVISCVRSQDIFTFIYWVDQEFISAKPKLPILFKLNWNEMLEIQ